MQTPLLVNVLLGLGNGGQNALYNISIVCLVAKEDIAQVLYALPLIYCTCILTHTVLVHFDVSDLNFKYTVVLTVSPHFYHIYRLGKLLLRYLLRSKHEIIGQAVRAVHVCLYATSARALCSHTRA